MPDLIDEMLRNATHEQTKEKKISFKKYLLQVQQHPDLAAPAHLRLYNTIMKYGSKQDDSECAKRIYGDNIPITYNYFEDNFFGMDVAINKIMNYLYSAANKSEEAKQVLYLMGPVGSGKSSLVDALKKALELSDGYYALDGCPMGEEPLHLLPTALREQFKEKTGVEITGELCPVCQYRLHHDFNGNISDFPVVKHHFSIKNRKGIGVIAPIDPNNQDTSVLTGSIDISKMDLYAEDDPRILSLNGAFNVGNRGIVEFIEVFKNDVEFLHTMLTATQEKLIPSPGKNAMLSFDGVIIAHSNQAEWEKFQQESTNEAILDRLIKINIPYCLEIDKEIKIYEKMLSKTTFKVHIAPHTLEIAATFAIMTRLVQDAELSMLQKAQLYNGIDICTSNRTKYDVVKLKQDAILKQEGMFGISTRFIFKALSTAITTSKTNCVTPLDFLNVLEQQINESSLPEELITKYIEYIKTDLYEYYSTIIKREVTDIIIAEHKEDIQDLFELYIEKLKANSDVLDDFMQSMNNLITHEEMTPEFKQDLLLLLEEKEKEKGKKVEYTDIATLASALNQKFLMSTKATILTELQSSKPTMTDCILNNLQKNGYCKHCSKVILDFVIKYFWKE